MYRNWHFELAPKLEFGYFAERISKYSGNKDVKAHMEKLRGVYKGDVDHFVPFGDGPDNLINLKDGFDLSSCLVRHSTLAESSITRYHSY